MRDFSVSTMVRVPLLQALALATVLSGTFCSLVWLPSFTPAQGFLDANGIRLHAASETTLLVNITNDTLCNTQAIAGIIKVNCNFQGIEASIVAPYGSLDSYEYIAADVHYKGAKQLTLVKPCLETTTVENCSLASYVADKNCAAKLFIKFSEANELKGKFKMLNFIESNCLYVHSNHEYFKATATKFSTLVLVQVNHGRGYTEIRQSNMDEFRITTDTKFTIKGSHIGIIPHGAVLILNTHVDIAEISNTSIKVIYGMGIELVEGGILRLQNVHVGHAYPSAFKVNTAAALHLENVTFSSIANHAFLLFRDSLLTLRNVSVASKLIDIESDIVFHVKSRLGHIVQVTDQNLTQCIKHGSSIDCNFRLDSDTNDFTVSLVNEPEDSIVTITNARGLSIKQCCVAAVHMSNVEGAYYERFGCSSHGNITLEYSSFSLLVASTTDQLTILKSYFGAVMILDVARMHFYDVTIKKLNELNVTGTSIMANSWDKVYIGNVGVFYTTRPINITNSMFTFQVHSMRFDHHFDESLIVNTTFNEVYKKGIHLIRGVLILQNVSIQHCYLHSVYVEEGAALVLGQVRIHKPKTLLNMYDYERCISVHSMAQVQFLDQNYKIDVEKHIQVRNHRSDGPAPGQLIAGFGAPHCTADQLQLSGQPVLHCDYARVPQADVYLDHLTDNNMHSNLTVISNASALTITYTCVDNILLQQINLIKLADDAIHCAKSFVAMNSAFTGIDGDFTRIRLQNVTTPYLRMEKPTSLLITNCSIGDISIAGPKIELINVEIMNVSFIVAMSKAVLLNTSITTIDKLGIIVKAEANFYFNGVINHLNEGAIFNYGNMTLEHVTIEHAECTSINLGKRSHTTFRNINIVNGSTHMIEYEHGAQISFENVMINGIEHLEVIEKIMVVQDISHFKKRGEVYSNHGLGMLIYEADEDLSKSYVFGNYYDYQNRMNEYSQISVTDHTNDSSDTTEDTESLNFNDTINIINDDESDAAAALSGDEAHHNSSQQSNVQDSLVDVYPTALIIGLVCVIIVVGSLVGVYVYMKCRVNRLTSNSVSSYNSVTDTVEVIRY